MLMGFPPIGAPSYWGKSLSHVVHSETIPPLDCAGIYVTCTVNKMSAVGVVVSTDGDNAYIYIDDPYEKILKKEAQSCMIVTHKSQSKAPKETMQKIESYIQSKRLKK